MCERGKEGQGGGGGTVNKGCDSEAGGGFPSAPARQREPDLEAVGTSGSVFELGRRNEAALHSGRGAPGSFPGQA